MRRLTFRFCFLLMPLLSGCSHVVYYAPSGPGRTLVGGYGAPNIQELKLSSDSRISLQVNNISSPSRLAVFVYLQSGSSLRLTSPELRFECQPAETVIVTVEKITAGRIIDGRGKRLEMSWDSELVRGRTPLSDGGESSGEYWIETALPACTSESFAVYLPKFAGSTSNLPVEPIHFRLREGHFIPFHEFM